MNEKTATTGRSKTAVAIDRILEMIEGSSLKPGDRLPSERALAAVEVVADAPEAVGLALGPGVVIGRAAIGQDPLVAHLAPGLARVGDA